MTVEGVLPLNRPSISMSAPSGVEVTSSSAVADTAIAVNLGVVVGDRLKGVSELT